MKNMTKWNGWTMITLAAAVGICGCQKKQEAQERPPVSVSVGKAQKVSVPVYLTAFGRLRALNDVDVKPQVSGKLISAPFVEGTKVSKGDILFEIEKDMYQAAVDQAKGELDGAKATLKQSRDTLKRNEPLLAQKLISQEDYDQLQTAVDSAKAGKKQAKAALEQAQINLNYCCVTSPVTGVTGKRLIDPGNLVTAGGEVLVNVQTTDPLYLDFSVSEIYLPDLKKAMAKGPVKMLIVLEENAGDAGMFHGVLKMIDNSIDTRSGTIAMRALVDNPDGKLWPGQFVNVYPVLSQLDDAIVVPQSAVALGKDGPYSFIIKDNKADLRLVKKGVEVGDAIVVTTGIKDGETVVTQGQLGLWPGAPVSVSTELSTEDEKNLEKKLGDPNVVATIHKLNSLGIPLDEISVLIGIPADAIRKVAKETGPGAQTMRDDMVQKMKKGGLTDDEIAHVTGLSKEQISQILEPKAADDNKPEKVDTTEQPKQ